jgi:hypothetical protein
VGEDNQDELAVVAVCTMWTLKQRDVLKQRKTSNNLTDFDSSLAKRTLDSEFIVQSQLRRLLLSLL